MKLDVITREELRVRLGEVVLIEALPEAHYNLEHIPTAINIPLPPTAETMNDVAPDQGQAIVVYCSGLSCTRSRAAAIALQKLGYTNVAMYEGGKADWEAAGLPFESTQAFAAN